MSPTGSDLILERMMALHPKIIDLTLDRVWRLLAAVGHPERRLPPVVHIAGTNGKGSTLAMIRAGIEGAGQTAHAYTSPHLARFHERVRLAGDLITEDHLTEVLDRCEAANAGESITYFEITTVAALLAFAETQADWTLLEVGLGGRLDATNVVDTPALTIITPVSIDHTQFLGDTIAEIAGEKAGIIKPGVPVVVGPQPDDALDVIERVAARSAAPLLAHGQHWHVWEERGRLVFQDETGLLDLPLPALAGQHQLQNAGAALAALRHLGFGEPACEAAMTNVTWPARMQRLRRGPLVDVAAVEPELGPAGRVDQRSATETLHPRGPGHIGHRRCARVFAEPEMPQGGERGARVLYLVFARERRHRQIKQPGFILEHEPPAFFPDVPVLTMGQQRRSGAGGNTLDHV